MAMRAPRGDDEQLPGQLELELDRKPIGWGELDDMYQEHQSVSMALESAKAELKRLTAAKKEADIKLVRAGRRVHVNVVEETRRLTKRALSNRTTDPNTGEITEGAEGG